MLLTEQEISEIHSFPWEKTVDFVRRVESAVLEKLKAQEPACFVGMIEDGAMLLMSMPDDWVATPLYEHPLPPDDVVRDAERLDWLLKNPDVTVCSDGAYGPFHVWFRYSNRTTEPKNTARAAIDAAMEKMK